MKIYTKDENVYVTADDTRFLVGPRKDFMSEEVTDEEISKQTQEITEHPIFSLLYLYDERELQEHFQVSKDDLTETTLEQIKSGVH